MSSSRNLPPTLTSAIIETLLYGPFLLICTTSIWLLWDQNRTRAGRITTRQPSFAQEIPLIMAGLCLLVGTTAHWIIDVVHLFQAVVTYKGGSAPEEYLDDYFDRTFIVANAILMLFCIIITDAVCVYRLWIIWAFRRATIVIPICALLATIGSSVYAAYETAQLRNASSEPESSQWKWLSAAFASHLCLDIYCMTLIAGRLVVSECNLIKAGLQPAATSVITKALVIFIESASIYTGWAVFYCVSYETQSDARFVARDCSPAIAGLTFGLIIVQARLAFPQGVAERRTENTTDELRFASQHTSHMLTSIVVNVPDIAREPEDMVADDQHDSLPQVKLLKLDPLHGMQHGS